VPLIAPSSIFRIVSSQCRRNEKKRERRLLNLKRSAVFWIGTFA
jgi:hypothetical protein